MKDVLRSFYTNSEDITNYMTKKINIEDDDTILEPSAGEGIFIDTILKTNKKVQVEALDIDKKAIAILQKKYKDNVNVTIRETDTLFDKQLDLYEANVFSVQHDDKKSMQQILFSETQNGYYTKIIGNPPYGAWQSYEKRKKLKEKYIGQYVKETYSLFLLRCISVLKMKGRLSFIIPDTFLFLNMHKRLREILLTQTKIIEILIFPSKFFPGISFGYSNLSIITLEKANYNDSVKNTLRIIKGFKNSREFNCISKLEAVVPEHLQIYQLKQEDILRNCEHRFIVTEKNNIGILNSIDKTLDDVAYIATGFYTGNNKKFIRVLDETVRGAKGYLFADKKKIFQCTSTDGISNITEGYIPYIKSSSKQRYLRDKEDWFVRWDEPTVKFYKKDKKARFQNSAFYFHTGVGIPMVKSSEVRAFLMKDMVFDQSIVGIFPKDKNDLFYILALMNSKVINELIHIINPTANNSANYIKQVPIIDPSRSTRKKIDSLVKKILSLLKKGQYEEACCLHDTIDAIISDLYKNV